MREILFRGKRRDNKQWVEGDLLHCASGEFNINTHKHGQPWLGYCVIPETLGQYTGLTDKNGTKIFEGDIIKSCEYEDTYRVEYCDYYNYPAFDCDPEVPSDGSNGLSYLVNTEGVEVIGNIHDNPDLLGGANNETN